MNEETYVEKLIRLFDTLRDDEFKGKNTCNGVACKDCPFNVIEKSGDEACIFHTIFKIIEKWSEEHPPKKFKVSRMEYDMLQIYAINHISNNDTFNDFCTLRGLLDKGYFEGATGSMHIGEYYINCEVVD